VVEYHHYPRILSGLALYVSAGKFSDSEYLPAPIHQYWPFTGHEGITTALDALQSLVSDYYAGTEEHFLDGAVATLYVDGNFRIPPDTFYGIPSFVHVEGVGATTLRFPADDDQPYSVLLGGFCTDILSHAASNGVSIMDDGDGVSQTGVPGGYKRYEFRFTDPDTAVEVSSGLPNGIRDYNFAGSVDAGDEMYLVQSGTSEYWGWFESESVTVQTSGIWSWTAIMPTGLSKTVTDTDMVMIRKKRSGLKNVDIALDGGPGTIGVKTLGSQTLGAGTLEMSACVQAEVDEVTAPHFRTSWHQNCKVGKLHVNRMGWTTSVLATVLAAPSSDEKVIPLNNTYEDVSVTPTVGADIDLTPADVYRETGSSFGKLTYDGQRGTEHGTVEIGNRMCQYDCLYIINTNAEVYIYDIDSRFGLITLNEQLDSGAESLEFEGVRCTVDKVVIDGNPAGNFEWGSSNCAQNIIGSISAGNIGDGSADNDSYRAHQSISDFDENLNLRVLADCTFSWDATSGQLSWDADFFIDDPYDDVSTMKIESTASPKTLSTDLDRLVVTLNRNSGAAGTVVTPFIESKADPVVRNDQRFIIATRYGTDIVFWDGSIMPDGFSSQVGFLFDYTQITRIEPSSGKLKISVQADAAESEDNQIEVKDSAAAIVFEVDEDGDFMFAGVSTDDLNVGDTDFRLHYASANLVEFYMDDTGLLQYNRTADQLAFIVGGGAHVNFYAVGGASISYGLRVGFPGGGAPTSDRFELGTTEFAFDWGTANRVDLRYNDTNNDFMRFDESNERISMIWFDFEKVRFETQHVYFYPAQDLDFNIDWSSGGEPTINFDSDASLLMNRAGDYFRFTADGNKLLTLTGSATQPTLALGDGSGGDSFSLQYDVATARLNFNVAIGNALAYDTATQEWRFYFGLVQKWNINLNAIWFEGGGGDLGIDTEPVSDVFASRGRFTDVSIGLATPGDKDDCYVRHGLNAILCVGLVEWDGTSTGAGSLVPYGNHFNIDATQSRYRGSTGEFEVHTDVALHEHCAVQVTPGELLGGNDDTQSVRIRAWIDGSNIIQVRCFGSAAPAHCRQFNVTVFGRTQVDPSV